MSTKRLGDRKDGRLIRELDPLHYITGIIYPNRCDNEAFISERIDLTNINAYLEKKNAENALLAAEGKAPDYKYNLFQIIVTAMLRVLHLRPKLNRFIANDNFYQRNEVTTSFIVKKLFDDNGAESLAFLHGEKDDNLDSIHKKIYDQVSKKKKADNADGSTQDAMDFLTKIPRFLSKFLIHILMFLDRHGWIPQSIVADDPYYSSLVISNLGSIKMKSGYHHLTNWGTCSAILLIGEIKNRPCFNEDGTYDMRPTVDLGLTIDERLGDGYYYSKSMRLLRKLLENPELLEQTLETELDY